MLGADAVARTEVNGRRPGGRRSKPAACSAVVAGVMAGVMATMTTMVTGPAAHAVATVVAPIADRVVVAVAWSARARVTSPAVLRAAVRIGGVT
jgi:hypothetical protein